MPLSFSQVCILLQDHEDIELHDPPIIFPADKKARGTSAIDRWFRSNRNAIQQLNADSTVALLSTLLPERRTDRVYGIQAPKLCHTLCRCLGLRAARAKDLQAYTQPGRGNLGTCLERVFVLGGAQGFPAVSLDEVDDLMQFLAGVSRFSDPSIPRQPPGSSEARNARIANLLMRMSPLEAKWLIRLILKDFTPVRLDENLVLNGYHFMLPGILRFQNRFDAAISMLKGPLSEFPDHCDKRTERLLFRGAEVKLKPVIGVKVGRPHFHKARGIDNCISMLGGSRWVLERKYDGEYCEIHIDLRHAPDFTKCITIFSKSGKNSTADRRKLHKTLIAALRLGEPDCKIKNQAILLGEMVVYSDEERRIMPFSEIRKHMLRSGTSLGTDADSYPKAHEHLAIVFFDILLLDDEIIMSRPVEDRRECLRKTYRKIGGHAMSAEWKTVDFSIVHASKNILMQQFAASIAQRCEGLLLKPCGVPYLSLEANPKSYNNSYIKLKKDYSDGMGDEADFAIIGGSYNAVQAAKSGVPGIKWTDFHLGCLLNKDEVMRFDARPRFKVVGTIQQEHCIPTAILGAANGLGTFCAIDYKVELKAANLDIVNTEPVVKIETVFNTPIVFEVLGSGFEKPSNASFHMLRHPRVKKMHEDRTWKDAVSMQELKDQAAAAMEGPVSSESQETKRWLEKMEKRCVKKFERERTCTPKTRTATPSTRGVLTSPSRSSLLDGTTLVERPASPSPKRPREETSPTPCPPAKRSRSADARSRGTERSNALADITNRAPLPAMNRATSFPTPHTSKPQPVLLNSLSSKLRPCPQHATPTCQHPCPLESTTVLLAPCIAHTPYVALDLLVPHFANGQCAIRTSSLSHWQRDTGMHRPLSPTVSESPAYAGRKKIVLVEGKRRNACRELVENVCKALGKGERAEIWDWRVLEHLQRFQDSKEEENFLGALTWDEGMGSMSVSDGVEWLIESDRSR